MKTVFWWAQNEDVDPESFCLLQGAEAFEAERRALAEMGAPDTNLLEFVDIVPEDRDTALCEARATDAFCEWVRTEEMGPEAE